MSAVRAKNATFKTTGACLPCQQNKEDDEADKHNN